MLLTEYSLWFTLLCLGAAAVATFVLYRNNPLNASKPIAWLIRGLRFLSIFLLSFLLLGPILHFITHKEEKPVVVFAIDNSQSITLAHDTNTLKQKLVDQFEALRDELGAQYEVVPYLVGKTSEQRGSPDFTAKETNLSGLFQQLKNQYDGSNLGAVVLASDGLFNNSENPLSAASQLNVPIYGIALGDTNQRKDILIKNVRANQLVFKNNLFPIQIDVASFAAAGQSAKLSIQQNGKEVFSQTVACGQRNFQTITTNLTAGEAGVLHLIVQLSPLNGEVSMANNRMDLFVQVIDGRQKIAIIGYTPHPDLAAYANTLSQNQNYAVETFIFSQQQQPRQLNEYNLVILHQLPGANGEGTNIVRQLKEQQIPILYVLGAQSNPGYLAQLEPTLQIGGARGNMNDVLPILQQNFSLFTISSEEETHIKRYPPLSAPFGNYRINGEHELLFNQQIGYVKTAYPLMFFTKGNTGKTGFICGEGFWRWRMYDAGISSQQTTNNLISNIAQYLTSRKDQRRFRVNHPKKFDENEHIILDAELYNESYQQINTPEVNITLKNSAGKTYSYTFNRTSEAYQLDAGLLPPGNYQYTATSQVGQNTEKVTGQFVVQSLQVEFTETTANHQLLYELASQHGGKLFQLNEVASLSEQLKKNESVKPVIYEQQEVSSWIELKWLVLLLMLSLCIEWFVRKWHGVI